MKTLNNGDVVEAMVVEIRPYGVYCNYHGLNILVLGPDASPKGDVSVDEIFSIGSRVRIRIERYSDSDQVYRGRAEPGQADGVEAPAPTSPR